MVQRHYEDFDLEAVKLALKICEKCERYTTMKGRADCIKRYLTGREVFDQTVLAIVETKDALKKASPR